MKKTIIKFCFPLFMLFILLSCSKNSVTTAPYASYGLSNTQGYLKIVYASAYTLNPSVLLRINGQVVSGLLTNRSPFPGGGYNTTGSNYPLYITVPQGNDTVAVAIPKSGTSIDSIVLYSTVINLPDSGNYTLHIADTLVNSTVNKTISLLVKNDISAVDSGFCRYRFVNLMPNVAATNGAVDLYLNGVLVCPNIAYKQASTPFKLAIGTHAPGVIDTLSIPTPTWTTRPAGALVTTTALASYPSASTMTNQRVYTVFAMGYQGATGTRLPFVSFTLDKNNN